MVQILTNKKLVSSIKRIIKKKISHEQKASLFLALQNNKTPNEQFLIKGFMDASNLLARKKGIEAADRIAPLHSFIPDQVWLHEYQAHLYARYAYNNISSGAINKSFNILTENLNWKPENAWQKIAITLKKHKGFGFAAQCYANAGKPEIAARMLKSKKMLQQAGWYFEQAAFWKDAAMCYRRDKYFDKAGVCFEKSGDLKSAARCFKKAGTLEAHNISKEQYKKIIKKK